MTCLNNLNLRPSVRLFDTFNMYISEYAGTVLIGIYKKIMRGDCDREILDGSAKSKY